MKYGLGHGMLVEINNVLELLKIQSKVLGEVSTNRTWNSCKSEMIIDNAILSFKFLPKCLNTSFM